MKIKAKGWPKKITTKRRSTSLSKSSGTLIGRTYKRGKR